MYNFYKRNNMSEIHSKQPWFILNAATHYNLLASPAPSISHFYNFEANQLSEQTLAIPDGCVDIIFDCDLTNPSAKVCGTTLEPSSAHLTHSHRYFGIRFSLGIKPPFLDISADELVGQEINLLDLAPGTSDLFEQIVSQPSYSEQAALFSQFLCNKPVLNPSPLTSHVLKLICESNGNIRINELEDHTGYTRRTLLRTFMSDIGIPPKVFSRIVRCQLAIDQIEHQNDVAFSDLAYDLGFTDQSHFQREFKKLVSATPLEYRCHVNQNSYQDRIRYF